MLSSVTGFVYLFINDLVDEIKQSVKGVNIGDEWIVVLLYIDDICILTENEADLQKALNIVHDYCTRWNMTVNTDKTQIVHFRTQSKERTGVIFIYGEQNINIVSQYKMVAKSAGRALGLLIAKCKGSGGMPYDVYTKLYDALVQPIIDYGAGIWETKDFSCINCIGLVAFFLELQSIPQM